MPCIRFVNQYAGVIGGIERYMERTALLLRRNSVIVDCCYAEETLDSARFIAAFDHAETIDNTIRQNIICDLTVLHKVRDAATVRAFREAGRTAVFIHDHEYYCPRKSYYYPVTRKNCSRSYCELLCGSCAMLRRPAPDNTFRSNFGGFAALWREIRACNEFIVLSGFMRDILIRQGIPADAIMLIPPAITVPAEGSSSESEPDSVPHILSIGQLIRGKGVDQLLAAMHRVKTPCVLDIVGTGNDEAYLKQLAEPLGERIVFHGFSPNPEDAFRGARAAILPWRWQEPFGLVGPEALAHGVPLIGFDVGAVHDYLLDGQTGILVPPGDTDALAKAIDRLLNDPDEARAMGRRGRELVSARFTDEALMHGWQALLNRKQTTREFLYP